MPIQPVQVKVKSRIVDKRYLVLNKEDFIPVRNSSRLRYPTVIMANAEWTYPSGLWSTITAIFISVYVVRNAISLKFRDYFLL